MLNKLPTISFEIDAIRSLSKKSAFKFVKINGEIYVSDFNQQEFLPIRVTQELNQDVKTFITCNSNHFSKIVNYDNRRNKFIVEVTKVADIKNVADFTLFTADNSIKDNDFLLDTINEQKIMLVATSIFNDENEGNFHIISFNSPYRIFDVNLKTMFIKHDDAQKNYFELKMRSKPFSKPEDYRYVLVCGNIQLSDSKKAVNSAEVNTINSIKSDMTYYLNLWNKYNEKEKINSFEIIKTFRYVKISSYQIEKDTVVFYFDEINFNRIKSYYGRVLIFGYETLEELSNYKDFNEYFIKEKDFNEFPKSSFNEKDINEMNKSIKVKVDSIKAFDNNEYNTISMSLIGDAIMFRRRELASKKIMAGLSGIVNIHTWFTDNPLPQNRVNEKENIHINHSILKQTNLTNNQLEAIKIICETPDIAIIQGPPGTGKTTVINEAIIQLNTYHKSNKHGQPNNLVSGFRHETVQNLTDKIRIYDLPSLKLGKKQSDDELSNQKIEKQVIDYTNELFDFLNEKYKDLVDSDEDYKAFNKLKVDYEMYTQGHDSTIEMLDKLKTFKILSLKPGTIFKINNFIDQINKRQKASKKNELFLNFLYKIPNSKIAYDDLKMVIELELTDFKDDSEFTEDVLKIAQLINLQEIDFNKLSNLVRKLIIKYSPKPKIFSTFKEKDEIISFLNDLNHTLTIERMQKHGGEKVAILEYINSLNENPLLIQETLLKYIKVIGATNQQSVSKAIYNNLTETSNITFDNVFIDEAATSTPLDLFIPMAIAKEKIILVGDHKQLPNITSDEIVSAIEADLATSEDVGERIKKELKESLFEHLFFKAKALEKVDGIKRTITLDTQFRMHPKLGEFVSDEFYREEGGIKSIIPAKIFEHNYANLNNAFAHWIDVPYVPKQIYKKDKSRKNTQEAIEIAKHIKKALEANKEQKISIGVITLYRPQVNEIRNELKNFDIIKSDDTIHDKYVNLTLEYGTVDAFQGKEFDIVYLSIVFTEDPNKRIKNYSRLLNVNLLNVAFSRQKKCLIVVGNKSLFKDVKAANHVPSLVKFLEMVEGRIR
ncbi:AAA domain-containing protein [Liberiplasma polymorphum]|uniref:AAA domain-containing protein n=1 Tax=Liberiplasma polymorphum TaxID=3374570 RepID=UPI00377274C8